MSVTGLVPCPREGLDRQKIPAPIERASRLEALESGHRIERAQPAEVDSLPSVSIDDRTEQVIFLQGAGFGICTLRLARDLYLAYRGQRSERLAHDPQADRMHMSRIILSPLCVGAAPNHKTKSALLML